ncbi:MAG TPA: NAD(P)H-hydrate dehydratase [Anaerolineae bacterium]|jgi:NAD(P)H-hydrate epimerase
MHIVTVAEMRAIERAANAAGLSYRDMMQNAGLSAAAEIRRRLSVWFSHKPVQILVLVGPGNNGGDGLVCASALRRMEPTLGIKVYGLKPRATDDEVYRDVLAAGLRIENAADDASLLNLRTEISGADVIVDALLGTGTARPIDGVLAEVLWLVKQGFSAVEKQTIQHKYVVALDGVTGMNYDTGALDPEAPTADLTITFHAAKRGHYCYPAARACGELVVADIGITPSHLQQLNTSGDETVAIADAAMLRQLLPKRSPDANKGTYGRVFVIGGCSDYSGAPALAAGAAYRVGAGLVTLAVPSAIQPGVASANREATFLTLDDRANFLTPSNLAQVGDLLQTLDQRHGVVIGPGMGQNPMTAEFLAGFFAMARAKGAGTRLLVDADGLNHLSRMTDWPMLLPAASILTPHPGEMARLTGMTIQQVQSDRIGNALQAAKRWGHIVVLKGAYTVIAHPSQGCVVLPFSNAALAVAGTGDVLAGCIGGMLAQGLEPFDAAVSGAFLHATAGESWRGVHGDAGLLASDLLALLPDEMRQLRHSNQSIHS